MKPEEKSQQEGGLAVRANAMEGAGVRVKLCALAGATGPVSVVRKEGVARNKCEPEGRGWSGTGRLSAAAGGRAARCAVP